VQKALALSLLSGKPSISDIKDVVLLMQENRSFDHYFGTMSGVVGFPIRTLFTYWNRRGVFYQFTDTTPEDYLLPFHLDSRKTSAQYICRRDMGGMCSMLPGMAGRWITGFRPTINMTAAKQMSR
jgi:phospholipase C